MFDKIIFLVLSIRYIGKIEKTKCANGSEKLETMEIEGERSTTLKSFNRVLCRFKDCLTLHQWAILSSLINFVSTYLRRLMLLRKLLILGFYCCIYFCVNYQYCQKHGNQSFSQKHNCCSGCVRLKQPNYADRLKN